MAIDKLKYERIKNDKILLFLYGIALTGFLLGIIFITIISDSDKVMVKEYVANFLKNSSTINYINVLKNSSFSNVGYFFFTSLLGLSVIGIPIIIFIYFFKFFTLGFSLSSFFLTYNFKGVILSLIYVIPFSIVKIATDILITLYAVKISLNFIYSIFQKKDINYNKVMNKYIKIIIYTLISYICIILYETFVLSIIIKKVSILFIN